MVWFAFLVYILNMQMKQLCGPSLILARVMKCLHPWLLLLGFNSSLPQLVWDLKALLLLLLLLLLLCIQWYSLTYNIVSSVVIWIPTQLSKILMLHLQELVKSVSYWVYHNLKSHICTSMKHRHGGKQGITLLQAKLFIFF